MIRRACAAHGKPRSQRDSHSFADIAINMHISYCIRTQSCRLRDIEAKVIVGGFLTSTLGPMWMDLSTLYLGSSIILTDYSIFVFEPLDNQGNKRMKCYEQETFLRLRVAYKLNVHRTSPKGFEKQTECRIKQLIYTTLIFASSQPTFNWF